MEFLLSVWEWLVQFFAGYSPEQVVLFVSVLVVGWLEGNYNGFSPFAWMKNKLNLKGVRMQAFVAFFTFAFVLFAMAVTGQFAEVDWNTAQSVFPLAFAMYAMGQVGYQKFKAELEN